MNSYYYVMKFRQTIILSNKIFQMPRVADTLTVKQKEYKNAELVLCEFMALQEYDVEE